MKHYVDGEPGLLAGLHFGGGFRSGGGRVLGGRVILSGQEMLGEGKVGGGRDREKLSEALNEAEKEAYEDGHFNHSSYRLPLEAKKSLIANRLKKEQQQRQDRCAVRTPH